VLVGGMFVGTFFTLFVIPSIYMLVARDQAKDRVRENAVPAAAGACVNMKAGLQPVLQNPN